MKDILETMINVQAQCELNFTGICEGTATEYDVHPTGMALGEADEWMSLWFCLPCAEQAAWDS